MLGTSSVQWDSVWESCNTLGSAPNTEEKKGRNGFVKECFISTKFPGLAPQLSLVWLHI